MGLGDFFSDALKVIANPFAHGQHDLIVLRVALDRVDGQLEAVLDLTAYGKVSGEGKRNWRLTLQDLGISETIRPESPPQIVLPLQVQEGLRANIALMNPEADRPLWLDLVRPYGYLGMLPWERVLGLLLNRPVLRLPDFLERPRENTAVLESAIIFDPPPRTSADDATLQLKSIVEELLAGSSRAKTTVNVFTTAAWSERLGQISADPRVTLHPPKEAVELAKSLGARSEPRPGSRLWLDWICAAVKGRSIDVVHFVGRAAATDTRTGLLISSTPLPDPDNETVTLALINIADISTALTRVGAWAGIFTPPPNESVGLAMAFVADAFAHARPGTVLYHPVRPDNRDSLRQSLQFLFAPDAAKPPLMAEGFVYCQPAAVEVHVNFQDKILLDVLKQNAALVGKAASVFDRARATAASIPVIGPIIGTPDTTQTPNWASATQRYIESATLDQLRRNSTDVLFTQVQAGKAKTSEKIMKSDKALKETLSDIQKIVGGYLRKPGNF
jgi:hypothetical protein